MGDLRFSAITRDKLVVEFLRLHICDPEEILHIIDESYVNKKYETFI